MDTLSHPVLRMKGPLVINITDKTKCYYCETGPLNDGDMFCPSCGFPQNGTEAEQKKFIVDKRILVRNLEDAAANSSKARKGLVGSSVLFGISYIVGGFQQPYAVEAYIIEGGIVVGIFVALAIYAGKNAYAAAISGLLVFCTLLAVYAIVNPISIVSGIIWKVIILSSLIYGMKGAREFRKLEAQLREQKIDLESARSAPKLQ